MTACRRQLLALLAAAWAMTTVGAANAGAFHMAHLFEVGMQQMSTSRHQYGLNPLHPNGRSPSGRLYPDPRQSAELTPWGDSGWLWQLGTELGAVHRSGTANAAGFREYADRDNGLLLNRIALIAKHPTTNRYLELDGGAVGRDDGHMSVAAGRHGRYRVEGYFKGTPHVFATNARVVWSGAGTGELRLPAGLPPGGTTADLLSQALSGTRQSRLALQRDEFGLGLTVTPRAGWVLSGQVATESRDGTRAFGGAFAFPGSGQFMETVEPIDYRTTTVGLALSYSGREQQLNVAYTGSYFRNAIPSLTWDNAGLGGFSDVLQRGRFALAPDNDYHRAKLDYGRALPWWRGRLTATVSGARHRQNDALLPPTVNTGTLDGFTPVDLDLWNVTGALAQSRADATLEQSLVRSQLTLSPTRRLRLGATLRLRREDNDTEYTAFNPLTGQFGYLALDGGLAGVPRRSGIFRPGESGNRVRFRSVPFATDTDRLELVGDYRVSSRYRLRAKVHHERKAFAFREREEIEDDGVRLQLSRGGVGSVRVGYEYLSRGGDRYEFNPYEPFFSSSLPGYVPAFEDGDTPHTLANLRKPDLADQDRHQLDARAILVLGDSMDLTLNGRWHRSDYDADFGLRDSSRLQVGADWSWKSSRHSHWSAYVHHHRDRRTTANINDTGGNVGVSAPDPFAGGVNYPLSNVWQQIGRESTYSAGVTWSRAFGDVELELAYNYGNSDADFDLSVAGPVPSCWASISMTLEYSSCARRSDTTT